MLISFFVLCHGWSFSDWIHVYSDNNEDATLLYDTKNCSIKFPNILDGRCVIKKKVVRNLVFSK